MAAVAKTLVLLAVSVGLFACKREGSHALATPPQDTVRHVVDSIFPVEEDIRRFKAARNHAVATELNGASASRDALVQRFMRALERRDTADLAAMLITPAEFIDLYYPSSMYVKPPYRQSPELVWFMMQESTEKGIARALERFGGLDPKFQGYTCDDSATVRDRNRFWSNCAVRWAPKPDAPSPLKLFGPIMERDGRFKFVSYSSDL